MIFVIIISCFLLFCITFSEKRKKERARLLALARAERKEKIEFLCKRAREMPDKGIGQFQVWWAKNHEPDKALKKYYVF